MPLREPPGATRRGSQPMMGVIRGTALQVVALYPDYADRAYRKFDVHNRDDMMRKLRSSS